MEESIETRAKPVEVWAAWEKAHAISEGKNGKFKYRVVNVVSGEQFTIVWKTLFIRLHFNHFVLATTRGSQIRYSVKIKGLFAPIIRWLIGNKIRQNIRLVLKTMVYQLEK